MRDGCYTLLVSEEIYCVQSTSFASELHWIGTCLVPVFSIPTA